MDFFVTFDPTTGLEIKKFEYLNMEKADVAIQEAHRDFLFWKKTSFQERAQALFHLAKIFRDRKEQLALSMKMEMGKKLEEGLAEVEKCAITCEYFAENAEKILKAHTAISGYQFTEIIFRPLGVLFSIMPWNFPLWQVVRFAAPSLMAGNIIVLKHADITAGTALLLEQIFNQLNLTVKLLRNCHVNHSDAAQIIAHPLISAVTFTGSTEAGRIVAQSASKSLKKIVLELGGSDPYLILEDANVESAAKKCAQSRLQNCGQSCVAGKRFLVVESISEKFLTSLSYEMSQIEISPLSAKRFQQTIDLQVKKMLDFGGRLIRGGVLPDGPGSFYPATIIYFERNIPEINNEEVFGPVAIVICVKDTIEAIQVANSSQFGLGAGVFTSDREEGKRIAEDELEAGFVVVNDFVKSDPRIPFGGVKNSGFGRELGAYGLLEFVNIKTVGMSE